MFRIAFLATLLIAQGALTPASAKCSGPDPAIVAASARPAQPSAGLRNIPVEITVKNVGSQGQPGSTLQSVEILQQGTKVGVKGIPPLGPGKSYAFVYTFQRSAEAAAGTTELHLRLVVTKPSGVDCDASNDERRLSV